MSTLLARIDQHLHNRVFAPDKATENAAIVLLADARKHIAELEVAEALYKLVVKERDIARLNEDSRAVQLKAAHARADRLEDGIMRGDLTTVVKGNDMIDWGWCLQPRLNRLDAATRAWVKAVVEYEPRLEAAFEMSTEEILHHFNAREQALIRAHHEIVAALSTKA